MPSPPSPSSAFACICMIFSSVFGFDDPFIFISLDPERGCLGLIPPFFILVSSSLLLTFSSASLCRRFISISSSCCCLHSSSISCSMLFISDERSFTFSKLPALCAAAVDAGLLFPPVLPLLVSFLTSSWIATAITDSSSLDQLNSWTISAATLCDESEVQSKRNDTVLQTPPSALIFSFMKSTFLLSSLTFPRTLNSWLKEEASTIVSPFSCCTPPPPFDAATTAAKLPAEF
mmetsp:Transcript_14433/g.27887  ORF Transcript_14433/g.27887 Transcript_14433/m.27887 type:complete len:233 (+) Transcript_14433:2797-3495(+)